MVAIAQQKWWKVGACCPRYYIDVCKFPSRASKRIDARRRAFLWGGKEHGCNCLVNWDNVWKGKETGSEASRIWRNWTMFYYPSGRGSKPKRRLAGGSWWLRPSIQGRSWASQVGEVCVRCLSFGVPLTQASMPLGGVLLSRLVTEKAWEFGKMNV